MATVVCGKCGAENREGAVACHHCQSPLSVTGVVKTKNGERTHRGPQARTPRLQISASNWICWCGAALVVAAFAQFRRPTTALWADLIGAASLALLLALAFNIPFLGGYIDLSVGGVSALASLSAQRLFYQGVLASILSGLIVGFVFGLGLAVLGIPSQKKSWWITGFVGALTLVATAAWELHGAPQPPPAELMLPGEMTGAYSVLVPTSVALVVLYLVIHQTTFGRQLRSLQPEESKTESEQAVRGAFLLSGIVAGFAGACAGALLTNAGLSHASMFALSPLALLFLSGASLDRRTVRWENLPAAAALFAGVIFLIATPGWVHVSSMTASMWKRSAPLLPATDGSLGLGFSVTVVALLVFRDCLLTKVPVDAEDEKARKERSRVSRGRRPRISLGVSPAWVVLLGCVMLLGVGITVASALLHSGASDVAVLRDRTGDVQRNFARQSNWTRAERGDTLSVGDSLKTGTDSYALVKLPAKNAVRIDPSTTATLQSLSDPTTHQYRTQLSLPNGRLWAEVNERLGGAPEAVFEIRTPSATAAVRGTQFLAEARAEGTIISVNEGFVNVTNGRETITVDSGKRCFASKRGGIQFPERMTAREIGEWKERAEELHGIWFPNISRTLRNILVGILALMILIGVIAEMLYGESRPGY